MCVLFTFHPLQIKSKSPAPQKRITIRGVNMVISLWETGVTRPIRGGPVLLWEVWGLLFHVAGARGTWQGSYHPATVGWISLNNLSFKQNTARWANCASTLCSQASWILYKNWGAECFLVTNLNFPWNKGDRQFSSTFLGLIVLALTSFSIRCEQSPSQRNWSFEIFRHFEEHFRKRESRLFWC